MPMKKNACIAKSIQNFRRGSMEMPPNAVCIQFTKGIPKKYLRQSSIDFDFCNISSSCDVVYKGRWLTQAGYWFILRFCEYFTCLSSKFKCSIVRYYVWQLRSAILIALEMMNSDFFKIFLRWNCSIESMLENTQ
jgi:hypothetical protein